MPEHVLAGCRPVPLAHYLKALGVLRLVAEQTDPAARGAWQRERFVLQTDLDRDALEGFFLEAYRPTPIVAPWNGGSGFYPKDNKKAIDALAASPAERFADYGATIARARAILEELGIEDKPAGITKAALLERCRATFPDSSLPWLDATYVLSVDGPKYPPLLGTGGNDGRLDFTNNFMQRLLWLLDETTGEALPAAKELFEAAIFDTPTSEMLRGAPIGQFLPSHAGGANADTSFGADSLINPWDFVLMLEGATAFATATVRRTEQESGGVPSYPFTVRTVGIGYASAAKDDETTARAEIWLPLWSRPAKARETLALLAEGRVRVGHRTARNGLDFARAIAGLGVDRGIDAFQRYGFQVRNGLAYFAVPLGRFAVKAEPRAALLGEIDGWLQRSRRANTQTAPASATRTLRRLEAAIFELCTHGDPQRLEQVLIALGKAEQVMATSVRWTKESYLQPIPPLSPDWLPQIDDGSPELRLAASLASVYGYYGSSDTKKGTFLPLRRQLEPVKTWTTDSGVRARWDFDAGRDVAWTSGHLIDALSAVLGRRLVRAVQAGATTYPDRGGPTASLGDIADFIEGRVDDQRLADLLWGFTLLDWSRLHSQHFPRRRIPARAPLPGALYALLKLCFAGASARARSSGEANHNLNEQAVSDIPIALQIHRLAAAGQGAEASAEAIRRLRGSGFAPAVTPFQVKGEITARSAAALLFPISARDHELLTRIVCRPGQAAPDTEPDAPSDPEPTTIPSGVIA